MDKYTLPISYFWGVTCSMFGVLSLNDIAIIIGIVLTNYSDEIRTSKTWLEIIGNAESCIREPYYCPVNILTVGIGSTGSVEQKRYTDRVKGCYLFSSNYSC